MKKILVIDDDPSILQALHDGLTDEGFFVLLAQNGEEGLKVAVRERPSLILLDILMPKMNGLEMLKKLRESEWGKSTEIIMLTNLLDKEKIADAMEFGAYDYIIKTDWPIKNIVSKIREKLMGI